MNEPSDATVDTPGVNPLWEFALALYSKPGVEETLLSLQERRGARVPLLLWACWLADRGVALDPDQCRQAHQLTDAVHQQWVEPIRQLRRPLSTASDPLQQQLKRQLLNAELTAEQWVLGTLYEFSQPLSAAHRPVSVADNLHHCLTATTRSASTSQGAAIDWQPLVTAVAAMARSS